jgi:hypothetical protein
MPGVMPSIAKLVLLKMFWPVAKRIAACGLGYAT